MPKAMCLSMITCKLMCLISMPLEMWLVQPLLAHKAMKEGAVAAEHASGKTTATYDTIVPSVVYTSPELASVGMTEKEAKDAGHKVRVGIFPLAVSGRAMTLR